MTVSGTMQQGAVVDLTWRRLHMTQTARKAVLSSTRLVLATLLLFADMSYSIVSRPLSITHPIVWFVELAIVVLMLFQFISNGMFLTSYFWSCFFGKALNVSEEQRRLLAINPNDSGFRTPPRVPRGGSLPPSHLSYSAGDNISFISRSPSLSPHSPHSPASSYNSYTSPNTSYSPSFLQRGGGVASPYSSFLSNSSGRNASFNTSGFNTSLDRSMNLSHSFSKSEVMDRHSLRSRRSASLPVSSRTSKYKHITDVDTLKRYIEEEDERELNKSQVSMDTAGVGGSFWSYGASPLECSAALRRFSYQLAPRTPACLNLRSSSEIGGSSTAAWAKYRVTEDDLYLWTEKLRKWLSATIISKLQEEIEEINSKLQKFNTEDRIGRVGVSTLSALAKQRMDIPTLTSVFPYLEFHANQEYLCTRIKELSTGSMSAYTWDRGGSYGGPWDTYLPTDAALVMHMFSTYLDARLPHEPHTLAGQPFTSRHFVLTPDKPMYLDSHLPHDAGSLSGSPYTSPYTSSPYSTRHSDKMADKHSDPAGLQIHQVSINPPHFQLVIDGEVLTLTKGRNNMFQAILLFLYHIKVKEAGMLGRINLGMSGLNILWIFD